MISSVRKWSGSLFLCLLIGLFVQAGALALDKKASGALSHYIMAGIYENSGDIDAAIEEYKKAVNIDNEAAIIHLSLASGYIKKNDIPKAIEEVNIAIKLDPEAIEPHAILALLYSIQGKTGLATGEYEIALKNASKLQPGNIDIYKSLGVIYLHQKNFQEAEKVYRMIIDLSMADAEAHFYLGSVYHELKNKGLAEKELKKALELKPDYHQALNFLGYLYVEESRNLGQAEMMIKKALEMEPENGAYIDSLGWLYFKKGRFKEAIAEIEKASLLLEDSVIFDHLGDAYLKVNNTEKAKLNWQKSLQLDAKQEQIRKKLEALNK